MRLKVCTLIASALAPTFAAASDWQAVPATRESIAVQVDRSSIARRGQFVQAWIRYVYATPLKGVPTDPQSHIPVKAVLTLKLFDCTRRMVTTKRMIYMTGPSGDREIVPSVDFAEPESKFADIVPDSSQEAELAVSCEIARLLP